MAELKKQVLVNLPVKESDMLEEMAYKTHRTKTEVIKIALTDLYNTMKDNNTI